MKDSLKLTDKILFIDGVHPQHNTVAACGWIKKGEDKEIKSSSGRQRMNINGALDIEEYKVTITMEETLNAVTILILLIKLRKVYKNAGRLYIIYDNAGYYKTENVKIEAAKLSDFLCFIFCSNLV